VVECLQVRLPAVLKTKFCPCIPWCFELLPLLVSTSGSALFLCGRLAAAPSAGAPIQYRFELLLGPRCTWQVMDVQDNCVLKLEVLPETTSTDGEHKVHSITETDRLQLVLLYMQSRIHQ
jgi:hypothetical protein